MQYSLLSEETNSSFRRKMVGEEFKGVNNSFTDREFRTID